MLALELIKWWYIKGWAEVGRRWMAYIKGLYRYFSVVLLLKTLFSPWKRIVSYGRKSIQERFRAALDNLVSRMVGFSVRIMVIIAAAVLIGGCAFLAAASLVLWPLVPLAVPALIIKALVPQ